MWCSLQIMFKLSNFSFLSNISKWWQKKKLAVYYFPFVCQVRLLIDIYLWCLTVTSNIGRGGWCVWLWLVWATARWALLLSSYSHPLSLPVSSQPKSRVTTPTLASPLLSSPLFTETRGTRTGGASWAVGSGHQHPSDRVTVRQNIIFIIRISRYIRDLLIPP